MSLTDYYEQEGRIWEAAHSAEDRGDLDRAIALYERAEGHGFQLAAALCRKQKYFDRAIQNYERAGWRRQATELAEWKKGLEERIETDVKWNWFHRAGEAAEELGDTARATEFYRKQLEQDEERNTEVSLCSAIELAMRIGEVERLPGLREKLFQRHEKYSKTMGLEQREYINPQWAKPVARLAEQLGHVERAIHYYEKGHCFTDAIRLVKLTGDTERLHQLYVNAARHGESPLEQYHLPVEELGTEATISIYEEAGRCHDAAKLAEQAGDFKRAILLYLKNNLFSSPRFEDAAALAEKLGDKVLVRKIYEQGIQYFKQSAEKSGDSGCLGFARELEEKLVEMTGD